MVEEINRTDPVTPQPPFYSNSETHLKPSLNEQLDKLIQTVQDLTKRLETIKQDRNTQARTQDSEASKHGRDLS